MKRTFILGLLLFIATSASGYQKPVEAVLRKQLTPMQYQITQESATEPAFDNAYWNNKKAGIYVDRISGEPLFSSQDKYDSKTGWPSFTRPLNSANIVTKEDSHLFFKRTEVRSAGANSHLGHLFDDGPAPLHKRYCINSGAMEFIPVEQLKARGYQQYLKEFTQ